MILITITYNNRSLKLNSERNKKQKVFNDTFYSKCYFMLNSQKASDMTY